MPFRRFRAPSGAPQTAPALPAPPTLEERRRAALDRSWSLMQTTVPTADILASYLTSVMDDE